MFHSYTFFPLQVCITFFYKINRKGKAALTYKLPVPVLTQSWYTWALLRVPGVPTHRVQEAVVPSPSLEEAGILCPLPIPESLFFHLLGGLHLSVPWKQLRAQGKRARLTAGLKGEGKTSGSPSPALSLSLDLPCSSLTYPMR